MKSQARAKVGGRKGNPGYRTPSSFKARQSLRAKNYSPTNLQISYKNTNSIRDIRS